MLSVVNSHKTLHLSIDNDIYRVIPETCIDVFYDRLFYIKYIYLSVFNFHSFNYFVLDYRTFLSVLYKI